MGARPAGHVPGREASQSLGFLVGSSIGLILSVAFAAGTLRPAVGPAVGVPDGRINPNEASAASLARLPGIGPTRAQAIVALREQLQDRHECKPAFRRAEDLAQVKGIGPATVDGIRPWLRFDPASGDSNGPSIR